MILNPFVRCECGKIHVRTFIGVMTKCTCDRFLMVIKFDGTAVR